MAIKTRATSGAGVTVKGSPLTVAELDTNFIELATKLNYVDGVTSPIQTQLNLKSTIINPTFIQDINEPLVGSLTSNGSPTVVGTGTNFLSFRPGDVFTQVGGPAITFTILSITDDLNLTATTNVTSYPGMSGAISRTGTQTVSIIKINGTRGLEIATEVFADNTSASALAAGTIYRTSTGVLMIKY